MNAISRRAAELAEKLQNTIVFYGDASDQELLAEEHIDSSRPLHAVTNDDEANIMSAMLAKRMGAKKVMVLIQRKAYVDLVQGSVIDIAISPQQATISALLSHVRKADIVGVSSLRRGVAEAIEAVATEMKAPHASWAVRSMRSSFRRDDHWRRGSRK
ncbi:Trk system potassium uptake protein trkA [Raoultella terrigena]|uniref:Trk system potassium uptake protein trkA n=1 Tax=Raoultella terrigena TaxID=577 RepID=A0A4V6YW44_RAOTE|nr:Trk system potassium uptake protein trkA [Raoultella terrigena]